MCMIALAVKYCSKSIMYVARYDTSSECRILMHV